MQRPIPEIPRAISAFGDNDWHGVGNGKHAAVEKLMMERAQGEAVALLVRPAGLMAFDVRRLDSDQNIPSRTSKPHTAQLYS